MFEIVGYLIGDGFFFGVNFFDFRMLDHLAKVAVNRQ